MYDDVQDHTHRCRCHVVNSAPQTLPAHSNKLKPEVTRLRANTAGERQYGTHQGLHKGSW